ncbi:glycosyltransferase family 4 protein [Methanosarcina sp. MSH10X1]|uniref:glycosyltransferase family 4 protein n=1 Tax=Methanosarcina sp. MSH10X1 TaxID=2507075 RepID=UPI0013E3CD53|nr:glycosyltransferase family 4 protein [Methanosarcina sp. MSH10X1]
MNKKCNIIGITSGGLKGFSGVNAKLFATISKEHNLIDVVDNRLSGIWKYYNALYCFVKVPGFRKYIHPINEIYNRSVASCRFRNMYYVLKRTQAAEKALNYVKEDYNIILQTGWVPCLSKRNNSIRCIYTDFTIKLSEREIPQWAKFLNIHDRNRWFEMERLSYQNADVVFTLSNHTRQSIICDYGVDESKVVTVYGGVDLSNIPNIEKNYSNIILFVGIDFERKGGFVLLEAFQVVKTQMKNAKLVIVGSKPDISIEGVDVRGFVSETEKYKLYSDASIFVMPSIGEPFGLVFLEAMAYKLPCIGTTAGAMPEIIVNGETGFLVEPNNPGQLAQKIICLMENKDLMEKMGSEGRKRVENFTWEKVVERMTLEFEKRI